MAEALPLKGMNRWLTVPTTWGGLTAAGLAVVYAWFELHFPPGTLGWFLVLATTVVGVATALSDLTIQRGLLTLRQLASGEVSESRELLKAAVREVTRTPDRAFRVGLWTWFLGSLTLAVAFTMLPRVTWELGARLLYIGCLFGPTMTLITNLALLRRSRRAVERLVARGLTPQDVIQAVPTQRRQMRQRLMLFTVMTIVTPAILIVEVGVSRTEAALDQVLVAPDVAAGAHVVAQARTDQLTATVVLAGIVVALLIFSTGTGGAALAEPMRAMSEQAQRIAQGDLSRASLTPAEDELWAASAAFAAMHHNLGGVLTQLQRAGVKISSTTEQIVQMSSRHQSGATEQAASLSETMATTEELARSARQIAQDAGTVAQMAEETLAAARTGQRNAETFLLSMSVMRRDNQGIADSVVRLNKRVQQIGKIIEFINGIADKSDLLALNAELEGTKAGDVGRGFSLVAAEMRRVAENVMQSTRQISQLIEEIRDATNAAVMATEAGVKATDAGSVHSADLSNRLRVILDLALATADAVRAISLATQQQQAGTDQLAQAMSNVLQVTQQGTASTRQLGAANADLVSLARDLKTVVDRFRVT